MQRSGLFFFPAAQHSQVCLHPSSFQPVPSFPNFCYYNQCHTDGLGQTFLGTHACSSLGVIPQSKIAGSTSEIVKDTVRVADPIYIPNGRVLSSPLRCFYSLSWKLLSKTLVETHSNYFNVPPQSQLLTTNVQPYVVGSPVGKENQPGSRILASD